MYLICVLYALYTFVAVTPTYLLTESMDCRIDGWMDKSSVTMWMDDGMADRGFPTIVFMYMEIELCICIPVSRELLRSTYMYYM